jgi:hypothetical protein
VFWEYNGDVGRRGNVDPIYKNSPYEAFANNPIIYIDPTGLDSIKFSKNTTIITPKQTGFSSGGQKPSGNTSFGISTVPMDGPDVFTFTNTHTTINGDGKLKTTITTQVLHPEDLNSAIGVTKGKNLYFDGLITTERKNNDWETVGKFMDLDKGFKDYMIARTPGSKLWNEAAGSIALMEGLMPVLVQSALGAWAGFRFGGVGASSNVLKYDARVRMRAVQDPVSHNFPYSFDSYILNTQPILKSNGYKMYQLPGTMHGSIKNGVQQIKNGVYEIGVRSDGVIDHRFFRPQ